MSATTIALSLAAHAEAAEPSPVEMVDALNVTFGAHAGKRASHAKGFCAVGEFKPDPKAAAFANSPMFRGGALPTRLRFSIGGGHPALRALPAGVRRSNQLR